MTSPGVILVAVLRIDDAEAYARFADQCVQLVEGLDGVRYYAWYFNDTRTRSTWVEHFDTDSAFVEKQRRIGPILPQTYEVSEVIEVDVYGEATAAMLESLGSYDGVTFHGHPQSGSSGVSL